MWIAFGTGVFIGAFVGAMLIGMLQAARAEYPGTDCDGCPLMKEGE